MIDRSEGGGLLSLMGPLLIACLPPYMFALHWLQVGILTFSFLVTFPKEVCGTMGWGTSVLSCTHTLILKYEEKNLSKISISLLSFLLMLITRAFIRAHTLKGE